MLGIHTILALASATLSIMSPVLADRRSFLIDDGVNHTIFYHAATDTTLDIVKNSGLCETTPGVNQYSGYISLDSLNKTVSNPSLCKAAPPEVFSAYVFLVLRSPT